MGRRSSICRVLVVVGCGQIGRLEVVWGAEVVVPMVSRLVCIFAPWEDGRAQCLTAPLFANLPTVLGLTCGGLRGSDMATQSERTVPTCVSNYGII